ncbi:diaminopimelate epimerase [Bacillus solimangrovi]|uniref:Diaminopimelate epimerase n=1 Tax=Bacillus solimangrovi TaxID=1305675 RepID=A0A1E5LIT0_9BACI|nr:diaminopimelate epimerase [Bacillus solimangrovi]OEH93984.1 diaminopimelate epimerase [Bacillus solimangrovi]
MDSFRFTKMHGLGNNYIYVNMFEEKLREEQLSALAIEVANINTGIGSDGLILICPSEKAPIEMRIFNSDGSEGKNCGNGLRCVAKYAYEHGIVETKQFHIETLSGVVEAYIHTEDDHVVEVTVDMGLPRLKRKEIPMIGPEEERVINEEIEFAGNQMYMTGVSMGNPHAVFFIDHIAKAPLTTLGPVIEKDERFPESINVEFVEYVNETELHFRVWERGSGITQACGTGACAAAVAAILNKKATRGNEITVHLAGGDLHITWEEDGRVLMRGAAETICEGEYYISKAK